MNISPDYYREFYKEIIKFELSLLPSSFDINQVIQSLSDKLLTSKNFILTEKTDKEEMLSYLVEQVNEKALSHTVENVQVCEKTPNIPQWTKRDLYNIANANYKIIPNYSEEDLKYTYKVLKTNNRFVQCGFIVNREKVNILFCVTKPKGQRNLDSDWGFVND